MEATTSQTDQAPYSSDNCKVEEIISQRFEAPRLDNLPEEILQMILCYIFPVRVTVTPWFNCGTSTLGIRGFGLNDEFITFNPNFDTSFLRVNRECYRLGTNILYSSNHFHFEKRPDCCRWWLKRIGDHNMQKIKKMSFILNTGWMCDRRDEDVVGSPCEQSREEQWFNALRHIQKCKIRLDHLNLKLENWRSMRLEPDYEEQDKEELEKYRKMLVDQLTKFRGIKKVKIEELGAAYIGWERSRLELLMQQPLWTFKPEPAQPKLTLEQLIEHCRKENEVKKKRIGESILARN